MSHDRPDEILPAGCGRGLRVAVCVSRFNEAVTERLRQGALGELQRLGVAAADVTDIAVPGAFELPMAALAAARRGDVDAVVVLGALIRGETAHFDVLAHATATALQDAVRDTGVPMSFGVLTCENLLQAEARAGGSHGDKGAEAAAAAVEMALRFRELEAP